MSTGAWICTGLIGAAAIAPGSVYAATLTKTLIAGPGGTNVASVTGQHQLLTVPIAPAQVMHANKNVNGPCTAVYTPPAHKAIVVTSVVYNYGSGIEGNENFGGLFSGPCTAGTLVDQIDQVDKFGSVQHTWPTGLPMAAVYGNSAGGTISIFVVGYLIPASALP